MRFAELTAAQLPDSKHMTFQLIGKDDSSFDDSEVLTGRWQSYIDSFVSVRFFLFFRTDNLTNLFNSRVKLLKAYL